MARLSWIEKLSSLPECSPAAETDTWLSVPGCRSGRGGASGGLVGEEMEEVAGGGDHTQEVGDTGNWYCNHLQWNSVWIQISPLSQCLTLSHLCPHTPQYQRWQGWAPPTTLPYNNRGKLAESTWVRLSIPLWTIQVITHHRSTSQGPV